MKKIEKNNVKVESKNSIFKYYKDKMLRKHLIIYIICMIIFGITFAYCLNTFNATTFLQSIGETVKISRVIIEFFVFLILSILLGFIPKLRLSIVCIIYSTRLASYVANILFMRTYNKIFVTVIAIISLFIISFAITIGMNMSKNIANRRKYESKK